MCGYYSWVRTRIGKFVTHTDGSTGMALLKTHTVAQMFVK